jgi:transposase-like protein
MDTSTTQTRRSRASPRPGLKITIESLNARYRRAVNAKGHFPTEQAALKTLYLVTRSLDPKGLGQARWVTRWKPALNLNPPMGLWLSA